ncbi:MAG: acyl-CoA/acyl-ACP dehydrogenase [Planctomycetia bacterium]|nr:acyl-CoA/acyl-ACP dehydrogenase [Planctomycetia bacterium]
MIASPDDPALARLCTQLAALEEMADDRWPAESLRLCAVAGVYRWFLPVEQGGLAWSEVDLLRAQLKLSAASLATTFILTQATGALKRLSAAGSDELRAEWLPAILSGERFCTLGISHLTTSRRHLAGPALRAEVAGALPQAPEDRGFVLDGLSPWVTGAAHADLVVTGAELSDGRQILVALPTALSGVEVDPPARLVGLSGSDTGAVRLKDVKLAEHYLLAGPMENVMQTASGAKTGGLQTSALAIGLAGRAIEFLEGESARRPELAEPAAGLRREQSLLVSDLLALAVGEEPCRADELRARANSIVLRAAQAALAAAKGTGYVVGHPAGRWCREALFFLVWSCPAPVMAANLCELAGISD